MGENMSDDKFDQAAFKIFRMTHEGQLTWVSKPASMLTELSGETIFPEVFESAHQGRRLVLYQERRRADAPEKRGAGPAGAPDDWRSARLALLGAHDEIQFVFPPSRQIDGLLKAVRYKASHVEEFLDELLKSEPVDVKQ